MYYEPEKITYKSSKTILKTEEGLIAWTHTVQNDGVEVDRDGHKHLDCGYFLDKDGKISELSGGTGGAAVGILLTDTDVTFGPQDCALAVEGHFYIERLVVGAEKGYADVVEALPNIQFYGNDNIPLTKETATELDGKEAESDKTKWLDDCSVLSSHTITKSTDAEKDFIVGNVARESGYVCGAVYKAGVKAEDSAIKVTSGEIQGGSATIKIKPDTGYKEAVTTDSVIYTVYLYTAKTDGGEEPTEGDKQSAKTITLTCNKDPEE